MTKRDDRLKELEMQADKIVDTLVGLYDALMRAGIVEMPHGKDIPYFVGNKPASRDDLDSLSQRLIRVEKVQMAMLDQLGLVIHEIPSHIEVVEAGG